MAAELTLTDVARSISVSPATLRRWVVEGIVPLRDGQWTPAALAQARIVARMRHRGHGLDQLRRAAKEGRLAYGYLEDLFPKPEAEYHLDDAVRETGLEPELIRRIWSAAGFSEASLDHLSDDDIALLRRLAAVLDAGLPLVAFLQLVRVYGLALAQMADAEVKLFHLFVHEPMIRDGAPVLDIAEELASSPPSCCRWPARSWTPSTSGCCSTSSSRTWSGTSSSWPTTPRSAACGSRSRSPTSPATRA